MWELVDIHDCGRISDLHVFIEFLALCQQSPKAVVEDPDSKTQERPYSNKILTVLALSKYETVVLVKGK